jgi:hypothetical protein
MAVRQTLRWRLALLSLTLAVVAGCGSSNAPGGKGGLSPPRSGLPPGPVSCPSGGNLTVAADIIPELLPGEQTLEEWQRYMVNLGPRFTGSPALRGWHDFMARTLASYGLDVVRDPIPIEWWHHRRWSLKLIEDGVETAYPVASYYPYSGFTPLGGIVGELADAGTGLPHEFALGNFNGKIAFAEEDMLPLTAALFYSTATYVHDPDLTLTPLTPYKRASVSFLTPQENTTVGSPSSAARAGAVGLIISYEASAENAAGQYTPFLTSPMSSQGVPTLYVDRATGDRIKDKIADGVQARLELVVEKHPGQFTDDIIATLPGSQPDEVIIFNSHSDGTSASQENGTLGIMALARYFSSLPLSCRQRSMVFVLTPGHFHNGIEGDTAGFINRHPEIIAKAVASVTMEHLGQQEWLDDVVTGFHPSGMFEPGAFYGSQNTVQLMIKNAVVAEDLRRTFVLRPIGVIYFGVGSGLNARGVPNAAYITGPNSMLSFANNQHLDKVDYGRMAAEIRTATRVAATMDAAPREILCAGMPPSPDGPTGCVPLP